MDSPGKRVFSVKKIIAPMLLTFLFMATSVQAQTELKGLEIGTEVGFYSYEEPDLMEQDGPMVGIFAAYNTHLETNWMYGVDGRFSYAQADYDSTSTGLLDDINNYILEARVRTGYDFHPEFLTTLTPYVGFGYRFLFDDAGGMTTTTNHKGYDRFSNYFYLPIGVDVVKAFENGFVVSFNIEYDVFLRGYQYSQFGDVVSGVDTLRNEQDSGFGARGSIRVAKTINEYNIFVEPFVRHWFIDDSDFKNITVSGNPIGIVGREPENNTAEVGLKLGMNF